MSAKPGRQHTRETAGRHMVTRVPIAHPDALAGQVLAGLAGERWEAADALFVVDEAHRLVGGVDLAALCGAPADGRVGGVIRRDWPRVRPGLDQEKVAALARAHGVASVPVVDGEERLLGCVPPLALLDVLWEEHVEDLQRLVGIRHQTRMARQAMEATPMRRLHARLPWLLVGLVGSMVATAVVARFEAALATRVSIAFFIPAIVYLADAIGTQTETVAVRGLSPSHRPLGRLLAGELATGALIGLALALVALPAVWLAFGDARLALGVSAAVLIAGAVATVTGLLMPWLLSRAGRDPAFGAGPVGTIIQDVLSLLIYFVVMTALLLPRA